MNSRALFACALSALTFAISPARATLPLPADQIALDTPGGEKLLVEAKARADYFPLVEHFVDQKSQSLCPVATSVMVVSALGIAAPEVKEWAPYHGFTQDNFFNDEARRLGVDRGGLALDQLVAVLETYPVTAKATHADEATLADLRARMVTNLSDPRDFVIVNWLRSKLDQEPNDAIGGKLGGHWSPLAAYHEGTDRFLVLDVARYKYPPFWVQAPRLYDAMRAVDADSGKSRGWIEVAARADGVARPPASAPSSRMLKVVIGIALGLFGLGALAGSLVTRWRMKRGQRRAASA